MINPKYWLPLIVLGVSVSGCATTHTEYVIDDDFKFTPKGVSFTPDKDGYWMSEFQFSESFQSEVDKTKRNA